MKTKIMTVLDAASGVFFKRELEHVKKTTYDVLYADLTYTQGFPTNSDVNPGATHIVMQSYDRRGMAIVYHNHAGDLPRVDVDGVENEIPVRTLGAAFAYTIDEINAAKMASRPLDRMRASTAKRAIEELMNTIAYLGDAKSGLIGLFTHPNIPRGNAPNGAGGTPQWSTKTPEEIRDDVNLMFRTVFETTKMVERPDKLLLTPGNYAIFMETALSIDNNMTIAQWFVKNSPYIKSLDDIVPVLELEGAGTGAVDVAVVMTKRADKVEFEIPQDVFFHEVEKSSLEYITDVTARCGGLNVHYPLSLYILEDV
jgi:hypothetical protein